STLLALTSVFSWLFLSVFSDVFAMESRANFIVSNLLIIFLVTALFSQFLLIHNQKEQQTKALAQAELDALQARIRPHFLFNSMNTAAELTHHDADAAEQAILALAALSQAAMRSGKAIKLVDEITLCQQYVALERWRYGERLALSWQLPDELPDIDIPCLTIQPIIENAVFYGVEPAELGNISVEMHQSDKAYTFIITNPVAAEVNNSRTGNGMALDNIRQRLALFYQQKAQLTTTIRDDVFRVKLVIPKQRDA
ncbi:MAG: histidine kinase, partial [Pseudomonadota bacterium]